jgi:hypothetical protein
MFVGTEESIRPEHNENNPPAYVELTVIASLSLMNAFSEQ